MLDLSIIIVSFNTDKLTQACLESIIKNTTKISYEIIVVDNGSKDKSIESLNNLKTKNSQSAQEIKIIENKKNLGYAKANNIGIKAAKGKAILLLNSDTVILPSAIDESYEHLRNADILTVNLKSPDMTNQQAAGFGPNMLNIFCWAFFIDDLPIVPTLVHPYQISDKSYFEKNHQVDWVMGAFFLMKRKVFESIGLLDENIFMYGEEMEYCKRARDNGFKIMYFNRPSIIHFGMGSSESSEGAIIGEYKALKYYFHKYYSGQKEILLKIIIKMSIIIRVAVFSLINRDRSKIYEKAFKSV